jgi:hypothetical protein
MTNRQPAATAGVQVAVALAVVAVTAATLLLLAARPAHADGAGPCGALLSDHAETICHVIVHVFMTPPHQTLT